MKEIFPIIGDLSTWSDSSSDALSSVLPGSVPFKLSGIIHPTLYLSSWLMLVDWRHRKETLGQNILEKFVLCQD